MLLGARPHHNELWAILLEKAWVKINGGYTNTIGGIFSEAILALTGFPTEIYRHKKMQQRDILKLYKDIEIGYKEGSIMACGTKSDDYNIENVGLIPGHAYSIVYPQKWKEKQLYLIKLRNPWGKNEWKGNWSDNSPKWTGDYIKYFNYKKSNDGTLWIELNDFINYFNNTYICHLLYGALVKYFYFEYSAYFTKPSIFNFLQEKKAVTSICILFKNRRFNREINNIRHPFSLLLCRYNKNRKIEKIWSKWDCEDEFNIIDNLEPGYYCIWAYCPLNLINGDNSFKYILQISSLSPYQIEFIGQDHDFTFVQYLITDNYKLLNSDKIKASPNFSIQNNDELFSNGLFNSLIYNNTGNPIEITATENGITNCQLLPPYQGRNNFIIIIPPFESAAIIGLRLSYEEGLFNFRFQAKYQTGGGQYNNGSSYFNIGDRYANYLKFRINSDSPSNNNLRTEEYKFIKRNLAKKMPIFNSNNFSLKESLRQSQLIKEEITPEKLLKDYPYEFNIIFKKYNKTGELEGRGVFFWRTGIKYVGYFSNNQLSKKGCLLDNQNRLFYKGDFLNNNKHGYGILFYNEKEYYEGDFYNDKMEGNGNYHFSNGDIWEGVFKNNMKNGLGILIKKYGDISIAKFENDYFIGEYALNNEEILYIKNIREQDKKMLLEQLKKKENDMDNNSLMKKNILTATLNIYKKKVDLTKSIIVY